MTGETSLHLPGDLDTAVCGELDAWRAGAGRCASIFGAT